MDDRGDQEDGGVTTFLQLLRIIVLSDMTDPKDALNRAPTTSTTTFIARKFPYPQLRQAVFNERIHLQIGDYFLIIFAKQQQQHLCNPIPLSVSVNSR